MGLRVTLDLKRRVRSPLCSHVVVKRGVGSTAHYVAVSAVGINLSHKGFFKAFSGSSVGASKAFCGKGGSTALRELFPFVMNYFSCVGGGLPRR